MARRNELKNIVLKGLDFFYLIGHPFFVVFSFIFPFFFRLLKKGGTKKGKIFLFLIFLGGCFFSWRIIKDLPSPQKLKEKQPVLTTKIYDRQGKLLYKIYRHQNRTLVSLDQIPPFLIQATLAIEDKEFWHHAGLSFRGIIRALIYNLTHPHQPPIGGSTITQQLVKNSLLGKEKTWQRKIKEAILSLLIEARFTKREILTMYFNQIPYGGTAYGVEEAAQKYFGKKAKDLTPAEAALLAGLPAAPTRFSPFGAYPTLAKERQKQVLEAMVKAGFISEKEKEKIIKQPLRFSFQDNSIRAPHFVFYVKDLLVEKYGRRRVEEGGLTVVTSLDLDLQEKIEKIVQQELAKIKSLNVTNAAVLVVRPATGEILAMVGSRDYFDFEHDGNVNVVLRPRQPGSAIKPINYAVAFSLGFTPATILSDTPITFKLPGQAPYSPKNYDGRFHGSVPLRVALASSLNVPAVKVLASYGVERMIQMGKKMGITTWDNPNRFGLSLTLGGGEVKMIDLAQAYSVLANLGKKVPLTPFLSISDYQKNLFSLPKDPPSSLVLDPGIAFLLNDILSDNQARRLGFGLSSLLYFPQHQVAVKTGTSNNLRDNWAIGYTPHFLVAVWVGNNNNTPMRGVASGLTGATPIWRKITELLLEEYPQTGWEKPANVVSLKICRPTGTLPCSGCPLVENEYFLKNFLPQKPCQPQWFSQPESKNQ